VTDKGQAAKHREHEKQVFSLGCAVWLEEEITGSHTVLSGPVTVDGCYGLLSKMSPKACVLKALSPMQQY
jgi:hypothetical protein